MSPSKETQVGAFSLKERLISENKGRRMHLRKSDPTCDVIVMPTDLTARTELRVCIQGD